MTDDASSPRYRFGPLERRGLIGGWRGGQIAVLSAAAVLVVGILRRSPSPVSVFVSLVVVVGAVAAVTWPIGGRTAEEWAPDAVRQARAELTRRARTRGSPFATLEVLAVDGGDDRLCAVVHDGASRTYSAVFPGEGDGFVLLGAAGQADRVTAWSGVLAAFCQRGASRRRLQWVARALPGAGPDAAVLSRPGATGSRRPTAAESYEALLEAELARSCRHEVLLVVTVDAPRPRRSVDARRGGHVAGCTAVVREAAWLRSQLADAGFRVGALLDPRQLHAVVRAAFDPDGGAPASGVASAWPWPMATEARWDAARVDGTWHVTYWVAQWPRRDTAAGFLAPLLVSDVRRTLAVVMQPVGPGEAARHAEQARTADIADAELRRRGGFLETARRRRQEENLVRREDELSEGHAQYRFSAYVTVSAGNEADLEDRCARTEQAAALAGLELRRCYGDQGRAFVCTLPLGRGLA